MSENAPILVTGATGFVGRHLVAALGAAGRRVRTLTRRSPENHGLPAAVETLQGDLCDPVALRAALDGVEDVVHTAADLGHSGAGLQELRRVNVEGTRLLAEEARAAGVQQLIHLSTAGVYGDGDGADPHHESSPCAPANAYEQSKADAEAALAAALEDGGTRWSVLRPGGLYGPGREATLRFFRLVQEKRFWVHAPGPLIVHPTYVSDVVQVVMTLLAGAAAPAGRSFNIGGEKAVSYPELIVAVGSVQGIRSRQWILPAAASIPMQALATLLRLAGRAPDPSTHRRWQGRTVSRALDCSRARAELGFKPVPLSQGLAETLRSMGST